MRAQGFEEGGDAKYISAKYWGKFRHLLLTNDKAVFTELHHLQIFMNFIVAADVSQLTT